MGDINQWQFPKNESGKVVGWSDEGDRLVNRDGGFGAMLKSDYDPTNVGGDAFDSDNHTFLQAGTGATERSAQDKMRDLVSVKDFGAVGDGVTDDTAAFSAAAQAAPAYDIIGPPNHENPLPRALRCSVYVPPGEYNLTSMVDTDGRNVTWVLSAGADFVGADTDYLNGRTFREGFRTANAQPYGILDDTTAFTVNFGRDFYDKPAPVTGVASVAALADYAQRDGVALATAAYSMSAVSSPATATYTATTATVALLSSDQQKRLRKGMVIETKHSPKYIGVLTSWTHGASTVLTVDTGWYEALNSAAGLQTPADGTGLYINRVNKIWALNPVLNLSSSHDVEEGIGSELSVYNTLGTSSTDIDTDPNRVWGYLAAAIAQGTAGYYASQSAFIARGWWHYGYTADNQDVGFYYKTTNTGKTAIKTRMPFAQTILYAEDTTGKQRYKILGTGDTEHGDKTVAATRTINFFTSGSTTSYDSRIQASGGSATNGQGTLTYNAIANVFGGVVRPSQDNVFSTGSASFRWSEGYITTLRPGGGGVKWTSGSGTPEGAVTAAIGSLYTRTDGGAGTTFYVKESGSGNTGWVAK